LNLWQSWPILLEAKNSEEPMNRTTLTIRHANVADASDLARLAALDSAPPLMGETLVAAVDGELWAAVEIGSGAAIADPFRPSAELVELLRLRLQGPAAGRPARGALGRLLPRAA
jgi:hypothetical protein